MKLKKYHETETISKKLKQSKKRKQSLKKKSKIMDQKAEKIIS